MAQARLAERDQRRVDRLVGAAFGAKRDAARRRDEQEARVLVAGVIERIEAAGDERVVERADREQPLAEQIARKARARRASGTRLFSAIPSSICWPLFAPTIFAPRQSLPWRKHRPFRAAEQAALVDPGAEVGRDGDVGRGGDDPVGERRRRTWRGRAGCGRTPPGSIAPRRRRGDGRDRDRAEGARALLAGDAAALDQRLDAGPGIVADARQRLPFLAFADAHRRRAARAIWVGFIRPA